VSLGVENCSQSEPWRPRQRPHDSPTTARGRAGSLWSFSLWKFFLEYAGVRVLYRTAEAGDVAMTVSSLSPSPPSKPTEGPA